MKYRNEENKRIQHILGLYQQEKVTDVNKRPICHIHTVTVFIASTYSLTLTRRSYGDTFLWSRA